MQTARSLERVLSVMEYVSWLRSLSRKTLLNHEIWIWRGRLSWGPPLAPDLQSLAIR